MSFVNCARYAQEQNMIAVQIEGDIYYEVCKDIPNGTELLVWYGDCYLQFMGVPVSLKEMADGGAQEESECKILNCFLCVIYQLNGAKLKIIFLNKVKLPLPWYQSVARFLIQYYELLRQNVKHCEFQDVVNEWSLHISKNRDMKSFNAVSYYM